MRRVAEEIARQPGIRYLATGFGRHDIVGHVEAASRGELVEALDAVRSVRGAILRESWHHLDIVKETFAPQLPDRPS